MRIGGSATARMGRSFGSALAGAGMLAAGLAASPPLAAQASGPPLTIGGLLRTGIRFEPEDAGRRDGFEVFDARVSLEGEIGIVFDYFLEGAFEERKDPLPDEDAGLEFELLDARLTLPIRSQVSLSVGQFKAPVGGETLLPKEDIRFLERAQASRAIAPGRQVGLELHGDVLEGRLTYRAGAFNGNGRSLENDDNSFLYAGRVQFNTVGPIEFYEDLVIQVGANLAFSTDSAVRLGPGLDGSLAGDDGVPPPGVDLASWHGDRFLAGFDVHASYRGWRFDAEYLRAELDPAAAGVEDLDAWGGYVEGAYGFFNALEAAVRYDHLDPVGGPDRQFLILGLNVFPGFHAKFGLQYAFGIDGSPEGAALADDQLVLLTQVAF